jgi:hypothetical protein
VGLDLHAVRLACTGWHRPLHVRSRDRPGDRYLAVGLREPPSSGLPGTGRAYRPHPGRCLTAPVHLELLQDVAHLVLHGGQLDTQVLADLPIGQSPDRSVGGSGARGGPQVHASGPGSTLSRQARHPPQHCCHDLRRVLALAAGHALNRHRQIGSRTAPRQVSGDTGLSERDHLVLAPRHADGDYAGGRLAAYHRTDDVKLPTVAMLSRTTSGRPSREPLHGRRQIGGGVQRGDPGLVLEEAGQPSLERRVSSTTSTRLALTVRSGGSGAAGCCRVRPAAGVQGSWSCASRAARPVDFGHLRR